MKIFKAIKFYHVLTGTASELAKALSVSRQAIYKAVETNGQCNDYTIHFSHNKQKTKRKRIRANLNESIELLKKARLIIDERNEIISNHGKYTNIGIIEDINRFLKELK